MDPTRATQLALGHWPARAFSAAIELGLFELLEAGPLDAPAIGERLGLRSPSVPDWLDALVALGALTRDGDRYGSTGPVDAGLAGASGAASYRAWADLPARLRGEAGPSMFESLAADELARFADAMATAAAPGHAAIAALDLHGTVTDAGGADGRLAIALARTGCRVTTFDLPAFAPLARRAVAEAGVDVAVVSGDLFVDELSPADTVVLSLVLLDWDLERKRRLLASAARAGPRLVVLERLDDGERPERSPFELLRSLHLLVTHGDAFPSTADELVALIVEAGYGAPVLTPVAGGFTLAVAERPG